MTGQIEYLALKFFHGYSNWICLVFGILIILILYKVIGRGGLPKPKKDEIWGWWKKILEYFEKRKK